MVERIVYVGACVSPYNVRTHVCVTSRARMRRERQIVVIAYFISCESETDNQARGGRVGESYTNAFIQACSRMKREASSSRYASSYVNPSKCVQQSAAGVHCAFVTVARIITCMHALLANDLIICEPRRATACN